MFLYIWITGVDIQGAGADAGVRGVKGAGGGGIASLLNASVSMLDGTR